MTDAPIPVIFIHGLWLHPLSWTEWVSMFEAAGYRAVAPGWPRVPDTVEAARANPDGIANHGIDDVASHYAAIIGQDLAAAAIAIDAAQINSIPQDPESYVPNVVALAKIGRLFGLPVVLSTVNHGNGVNSDTIPQLREQLPGVPSYDRASINAWEDADFVAAVRATGRSKLIMIKIALERGGSFGTELAVKLDRTAVPA